MATPAAQYQFEAGVLSYAAARQLQLELVRNCNAQRTAETALFLELEPTLSIARRTDEQVLLRADPFWRDYGARIVDTDRGGKATFHGPGQLVIYPVIDLRQRKLGVKRFVAIGPSVSAAVVSKCGVDAFCADEPAGVWVGARDTAGMPLLSRSRKIGFAGLKISQGVTDHGFAINCAVDLTPFSRFASCGLSAEVTSIKHELGGASVNLGEIARMWMEEFAVRLNASGS